MTPAPGQEIRPAAPADAQCEPDAFCQASTCVPLKSRGMLCAGHRECEFGLSCGVAAEPG